jgi:hypothetical protein
MYGTLISTITLASDSASVTFTSIPGTYTDLSLVFSGRDNGTTSASVAGRVQLNSTNPSNGYNLLGSGTAASSYNGYQMAWPGTDATANVFGNGIFYVPNYTSSVAKTASADTVSENNGTAAYQSLQSFVYSGVTSPVTTLWIFNGAGGGTFKAGSVFSLYGLTHF